MERQNVHILTTVEHTTPATTTPRSALNGTTGQHIYRFWDRKEMLFLFQALWIFSRYKQYTSFIRIAFFWAGEIKCSLRQYFSLCQVLPERGREKNCDNNRQETIFPNNTWLGGAMVLGKIPVPMRPTYLDYSRARAYCACGGCGWGLFVHFFSHLSFSFLSSSLWETAWYRLKYCLKGPLSPKQPANQTTHTRTYCKHCTPLPYKYPK